MRPPSLHVVVLEWRQETRSCIRPDCTRSGFSTEWREVLPPWLIDIGFGANSYSDYEAAIKLASAYFGTSVAREVRRLP